MLDLDGVVYVGPDAVPQAPAALSRARQQGMRLAFVTNNAARTPTAIADHLVELGVAARPEEVITSAQAAARYLADQLPAGARVLVVGTTGLHEALVERGLTPVTDASGSVDAVVQGFSPDLDWRLLAEGAVALNHGAKWVATNGDPTVPSPRGPLPGNGSLVAALRFATGRQPVVTGKPDPTMHRETVIRTGARRPMVVGDRLDTDIEGANAVGCDSLLVFTGVTTAADLLQATDVLRPTFIAADVSGLLERHAAPTTSDDGSTCGQWSVRRDGPRLELSSLLGQHEDPPRHRDAAALDRAALDRAALDAVRALCAAWWAAGNSAAQALGTAPTVTGQDVRATNVLSRLKLSG